MWRFEANRIGRRGIADKRHGLTSAPAKVDVLALIAFAELRHPTVATKGVEGAAIVPNLAERACPDVIKGEVLNIPRRGRI
jgi:hypothetical protein